jgi:hypothetical protein
MSNAEFERNRSAVHEIHVIESQILSGTLNKAAAQHNFNRSIGRA